MAPHSKTSQLLEINLISAQDLEPISKKMKTYATAWMNPNRKLSSSVDNEGTNNPTWNDKFVFRVEEEFLRQDTSAVMIEIYSTHWFKDVLVGTVRVLVGNLIPPTGARANNGYIGMRFVALQVRRPSGRPQGILNIGVALLDSTMKSMPLYTQPAMSAVGYRDLMEDPEALPENTNYNNLKPVLLRTKSERTEMTGLDDYSPSSSMIIVTGKSKGKEGSILSITECMVPVDSIKKVGKASSVICGAELREKPINIGKKGKASSVVNEALMSKESPRFHKVESSDSKEKKNEKPGPDDKVKAPGPDDKAKAPGPDDKVKAPGPDDKAKAPAVATIGKPVGKSGYEYGGPSKAPVPQGNKYVVGGPFKKGGSLLSDSEVGPSPSEVAAAMAERRYPLEDNQSSVLDGWSMDESVEGLRSKLERWRMELPPLYDRGGLDSSSYKSSNYHSTARRPKENESGLFSCFGNIFGYECQCVCGKPSGKKGNKFSPSTTPGGRSSFL